MYSYYNINSVADLVITFTVTDEFALTPVAERFDSTFHAAKCRTFQNLPRSPLVLFRFLFLALSFPNSFFLRIVVCFSWSRLPSTTVFFVRVASLFIDSNNVHFTVWFWDSQEGCGGLHTACCTLRCPVVSLCTWCLWHSCWRNIKRSMRTAGVESPSVPLHHFFFFFFVPRRI